MRDRLRKLIIESDILCDTCGESSSSYCAEAIADHLLANGVIVLPCKVGDTVYYLSRSIHTKIEKVKSGKVVRVAITETGIDLFVNNYVAKLLYGKRSFLTREEAEQALKGGAEE